MLRLLVQSKVWVSLGAAALCAETYWMCGEWLRFTMIAHVFFLTWSAYLFIDDEPLPWRKKLAPVALTGALVTFQGFEHIYLLLMCGALVLLYRMHWIPAVAQEKRWELRSMPLANNLVITLCWVMLCEVWPLAAMDKSPFDHIHYIIANALWIFALSLGEDFFYDEPTPDATLRLLGPRWHRLLALMCVVFSGTIHAMMHTPHPGVWVSLIATAVLLIVLPNGKRTNFHSWLLDSVLLFRLWR